MIELESVTLELLKPGLIYIELKDNKQIELEEAKQINLSCLKLCNNEPCCTIFNMLNKLSGISNEAQKFLANEAEMATLIRGNALVLNNLSSRIAANFYIKFQKPKHPTKVFVDKEEAITWIQSISKNV